MRDRLSTLCCFLLTTIACVAQPSAPNTLTSVKKGDVIITANIGTPHLFKGIVKISTKSNVFQQRFQGKTDISSITGLNPVAVKGEYAFHKLFTCGINYSFWTIHFNVTDHYNAQRINSGGFTDSVDVYKIKISSSSFGIRPVFHFPVKNYRNDFYIGFGIGVTKNSLSINFSSTDAGRFAAVFYRDLEFDLSLPGGAYIAPSFGYRHYFNPYFGLNFEIGYEKGAILQAGLAFRINTHKKTAGTK